MRTGQPAENAVRRLRLAVHGVVQGVGFRPFVYRLASQLGLSGWVQNTSNGVLIEVEGPEDDLNAFFRRLRAEHPPLASIQSLEHAWLDPAGYSGFEIRESDASGERIAHILPDIATCPDCLRDIFDPANRRHLYPFTNCTNCGPRFSIIRSLPYDRPNTTMAGFTMCPACRAEYDDPRDRRFHAQPNACPICGPRVELWERGGAVQARDHDAIRAAAEAIRRGDIVAVKGLGGFQLVADAGQPDAVAKLRARKSREEKPFALMYPTIESVHSDCLVTENEERILLSPESPIVLLRRRPDPSVLNAADADAVAPDNPYFGVMLPCTPLHHVLLRELGRPIVATSGNLSEEPLCTDEKDALARLNSLADLFLVHNRPIARHVDDSIVRVVAGRELVMRRARGYAPLPIPVADVRHPMLGMGAHLKNTVALGLGGQVFISQHIGDLETERAFEAFRRAGDDLRALYGVEACQTACDMHPDYLSSQHAHASGKPVKIQHHHAHIAACMAENDLDGEVLGVSWDGTGYGTDRTVWGGEFLLATRAHFERAAHLRTFRLPGGEAAVREPRRSAFGLLVELLGEEGMAREDLAPVRSFTPQERAALLQAVRKGLNAPVTSSMGRLFDAVASLAGLRQISRFEGQAAMMLEYAADQNCTDSYPFLVSRAAEENGPLVLDWAPLIMALLDDVAAGRPVGLISARFHNTLAEAIVETARRLGESRVVLSGGCFQNRCLTERAIERLREEGLSPYWHQRIPPNDGGIALGQVVVASAQAGDGICV